MTTKDKVLATVENPALIQPNNFLFKSLSDFSYNISFGCIHACSPCFVPEVSMIKQEPHLESIPGLIPAEWVAKRLEGRHWADEDWGKYVLLRTWDEEKFRKSLRSAQRAKDAGKLSPDGHGAIMFCTTTDPYQTLVVPGNPEMTKLLAARRKGLVRRALTLILNESDLNVRILTRSPLAVEDFDIYKEFGPRLLFGMSIPTLDPQLSSIYEPHAPRPAAKLRILHRAVKEGIPIYVALAPTYPEQGEAELRETIQAIMALNPYTIFHEPINTRAENVARIEKQAKALGLEINSGVFKTKERWREYAFQQLSLVEKICDDLNVPEGVLHLWPDEDLGSEAGFIKMKKMQAEREHGGGAFTRALKEEAESLWKSQWQPWLQYWHNPSERISAWPTPAPSRREPELSGILPSEVAFD